MGGQALQVDGTSCSTPIFSGIISLANVRRPSPLSPALPSATPNSPCPLSPRAAPPPALQAARLAAGKTTLGFVNPAIYAIGAAGGNAFTDIVGGALNK